MILIDVWSDIVCPFCYIGKRHLEAALKNFKYADQVRVNWKSFELDPSPEREPGISLNQRLAEKYGRTLEWANQMQADMTERARLVGLDYRFDQAVPANTFDAHRLIHFADTRGIQDAMKERLCRGYYTLGEDIGDRVTLARIGGELGLKPDEVTAMLESNAFAAEVRRDEEEARESGVQGVPFFVMNGKYAISGAQPIEVFERALNAAWEDKESRRRLESESVQGPICGPDGCEIA